MIGHDANGLPICPCVCPECKRRHTSAIDTSDVPAKAGKRAYRLLCDACILKKCAPALRERMAKILRYQEIKEGK